MKIFISIVAMLILTACSTSIPPSNSHTERIENRGVGMNYEPGYKDYGSYLPGPPVKETGDYGWLPEGER